MAYPLSPDKWQLSLRPYGGGAESWDVESWGMVSWVDRSVGEIVSALKAKGMWDNTLLVVSSDKYAHLSWHPVCEMWLCSGGPIYPGTSLQLFGG